MAGGRVVRVRVRLLGWVVGVGVRVRVRVRLGLGLRGCGCNAHRAVLDHRLALAEGALALALGLMLEVVADEEAALLVGHVPATADLGAAEQRLAQLAHVAVLGSGLGLGFGFGFGFGFGLGLGLGLGLEL